MIDNGELENLLINTARAKRAMTYQEILAHFGKPIGPVMVRALMRDLGHVCRRLEPLGLRDIACLVVRKSDGLPGAGYFQYLKDEENYQGPASGLAAEIEIKKRQDAIFETAESLEIIQC